MALNSTGGDSRNIIISKEFADFNQFRSIRKMFVVSQLKQLKRTKIPPSAIYCTVYWSTLIMVVAALDEQTAE